jgi:large subunit ribosomal protein L31
MKANIHPDYYPEARVTCACGNSFTVGSTKPEIHTDVCSKCHPFFTGEQRIVDAAGRVERFMNKLAKRDRIIAEAEERRIQATSPQLQIMELDIGTRAQTVLAGAGIDTVQDVLDRLAEGGDEMLTNLKGFGLKSLADLKKELRSRGFVLPGDEMPEEAGEADEVVLQEV